jgi:hypothetical protein
MSAFGTKPTSGFATAMSATDPNRTFDRTRTAPGAAKVVKFRNSQMAATGSGKRLRQAVRMFNNTCVARQYFYGNE